MADGSLAVDVADPAIGSDEPRAHLRYPAIDGLRAVAILLVVLNHADVPGFSRGFLGVDMFFALSGFLISDRIVVSWTTGSTVGLSGFWAGRSRRLLPATATVIATTCLLSALVLSPQELTRIAEYGASASVFMINNVIAWRGGSYFSGPLRELPFLHLWSLAVEEQFYLVWPIALGPVARWLSKVTRWPYRRVVAVGLGTAIGASLVTSIVVTNVNDRWAFYSLPTRVFEFALGGAAVLFWQRPGAAIRLRTGAAIAGLLAVVLALVTTPVGAHFPSAWPLLPVGGTVLVILGTLPTTTPGPVPSILSRLLSSRPFRLIGRYSYGWYLWHWPALVLGTAEWGANWGRVASVASLIPAVITFHTVEQRFRYRPSFVRSNLKSFALGVAAILLGLGGSIALYGFAHHRMQDPFIRDIARAQESYVTAGCVQDSTTFGMPVCLGGSDDPTAPVVLLIGDSHAGQWTAAFSEAGRAAGFRVATRTLGNCSSFELLKPNDLVAAECIAYQRDSLKLAKDPRIATSVFIEAATSRHTQGTPGEWYAAASAEVSAIGRPTGLVIDSPAVGEPLRCVARGNPMASCQVSRSAALAPGKVYEPVEQRLRDRFGVHLFDLTSIMCSSDPCPLKWHGIWITARNAHLNRDFTLAQQEPITTFVQDLLGRS